MKYIEVSFTIKPATEEACDVVAALAAEAGFESFCDWQDGIKGYVLADSYDKEKLDEALSSFQYPGVVVSYSATDAEDKNWNEKWEEVGFEPIILGDRCIIYDAKNDKPTHNYDIEIGIDACQAFGTGTHETTQLMVESILASDIMGKRVLDCGCGTGILSITAAKCGASEIVGYDIDEWSVENAIHNAKINNVDIEILEGDKKVLSHINGMFDFVLANINRNILIEDMPSFTELMSSDCIFMISGFYEEDSDILQKEAEKHGMSMVRKTTMNNWCCMSFKKD